MALYLPFFGYSVTEITADLIITWQEPISSFEIMVAKLYARELSEIKNPTASHTAGLVFSSSSGSCHSLVNDI